MRLLRSGSIHRPGPENLACQNWPGYRLEARMRTLSARILLGFAALTITFGAITGNIVYNQHTLESYVELVNTGLVPVSQQIRELARRCDDLRQYVSEGFDKESNVDSARYRLENLRLRRDKGFADVQKFFATYDDMDKLDSKHQLRKAVTDLDVPIRSTKPLYDKLALAFQHGEPLESNAVNEGVGPLRDAERQISNQANSLATTIERSVAAGLRDLQERETQSRHITIFLGAVAVLLGLLMTTWVVIALRPLRRLQNAARRVAAGDYGNRIEVRGPAEVADLARELNTMATAVEERERELVRSERLAAVGKMAAMITHEVRNPLSSIGLNTELLEDEVEGNEEARDLVRAIHREVDRLTAITEEYLTFARLPKPKLAPEAINPLVGALAAFVRGDLAVKKVDLKVDLAPGDPIAIIDAGQVRQCLINLVRNASEALGAKGSGSVTLRTRSEGDRIVIEVEDDGVGIPSDVLPRLFDPFFSTKEGGSGLGLALTQQIVKDHGGDLGVQSTLGKGTTFTVSVPAKAG
ncbi:MAG TPA: ATP-binding protein [Kofleriaceae bacterium]|nr:ATP-binding protein [Kofleriaceae bacterium]